MFKIKKSVFKTAHLPLRFQKTFVIKNVLSLFFCLHCCLINIHIFDYPDSRLSGLFTEVPTSPDNRGSTVLASFFNSHLMHSFISNFPQMFWTHFSKLLLLLFFQVVEFQCAEREEA